MTITTDPIIRAIAKYADTKAMTFLVMGLLDDPYEVIDQYEGDTPEECRVKCMLETFKLMGTPEGRKVLAERVEAEMLEMSL